MKLNALFINYLSRAVLGLAALLLAHAATAQTTLADQPIFAGSDVPGNLALALSVEFPTAISVANIGNYADAATYLGYFDPLKCYTYNYNAGTPKNSYFKPTALATGSYKHACTGQWSGNFMNWATMQTIDPFRWALSGGFRSVDTASQTILEKAWGSSQGSAGGNFNYRGTDLGSPNNLPVSVATVTPFAAWHSYDSGVWGNGNMMVFSGSGIGYKQSATSIFVSDFISPIITNNPIAAYRVYVRVDVCDPTALGAAAIESNCVKYGSNYKPEGLIQQYSTKIRFSAFSYLTQGGNVRQGGVLREPMGFVGPTYPQPQSAGIITNARPEWDAATGVQSSNPDPATAGASGVSQSGVINYLNKFGEANGQYMTYDNVGELYYAALRYYENLGNVPEWTNADASYLDGFPAVATWADPIAYSCQKNFILGIGDNHTWYDTNVAGSTVTAGGRPMAAAVSGDTLNQASTWTTQLQNLEGITPTAFWPFDIGATYYIAGLAYGAHVNDLRPDLAGNQTISTFWMDVEEGGGPENLNPYYLATKYGGFNVTLQDPPAIYDMTTPLDDSQWNTGGSAILMNGNNTQLQPNNYFLAGNANAMVAGLKAAFSNIANAIKAYTTSFAFSSSNVTTAGTESFATQYDSVGWTGLVTASNLTFDPSGNPLLTPLWSTSTTLQAQLAGTGWQSARRIATWNGSSGVPFQVANLTPSQLSSLVPTVYSPTSTSSQYLNYLRGDRTNEVGSKVAGSTKSLRTRSLFLGDVVDASLTPVPTPNQAFSETSNPGYASFTTRWTSTTPRPIMVYAGANDGMLHGFVGTSGIEQFAYIPSAVFSGPDANTQVDGLVALGNPNYLHHYYVDATPVNYDVDLNHTNGNTAGSPRWATLLIGGLGKGGRSFYAIDVTDPASMSSEAAVAGKVKWEFTDPTMGYSYGAPVVVKTIKYGWVVALTSGYVNPDGYGYLYLVNPDTGFLLEPPIRTPSKSNGLVQASAFVKDYTDDTADSIYVGDLNGQIWRFDLTAASGNYPAPKLIALVQNAGGNAQPVTTAPLIEIHPQNRKRYVLVGTGQLLASTDVVSTQMQSFYAFIDGTIGGFATVSSPITRALLTPVASTDLVGGATIAATAKGWYTDLGIDPASGIAWRVIINPQAYDGVVILADVLTTSDACSPSGLSRVYGLNYATATSILQPSTLPYVSFANDVINMRFANNNSTAEVVVGFPTSAPLTKVPATLTQSLATRLLNWREIPTAD